MAQGCLRCRDRAWKVLCAHTRAGSRVPAFSSVQTEPLPSTHEAAYGGREDCEPRVRSPPRSGQTQIAAAVDQVGDPCAQPGLEPCACPEARRRAVAGSLTRAGRDYLAQRPREGRTFSCSDPAWDGGMPPRGSWRRPGGPQPRRPAPLRRDRVDPAPIGAVTTTPVANTEDTSGDVVLPLTAAPNRCALAMCRNRRGG